MAGLYIHVPFCRKKCPYCNFFSVVSDKLRNDFIELLLSEANHFASDWSDQTMATLYLGGGTPSLLSEEELRALFKGLRTQFKISPQAEITLEVNPDDITLDSLKLWKDLGINRLSVGLQSLDEAALDFLERLHSAGESLNKLRLVRNVGFTNLSLDLIYGIPGLSRQAWLKTLEQVFEFRPEHMSAYALTLEEKTIYDFRVRRNQVSAPPDDLALAHFHLLRRMARHHGYHFYEVSNLSLPGYHSRHNTSYWTGVPYLGLGPSAHSFDGRKRWWNPASISKWRQIVTHKQDREEEQLSRIMQLNEYLMTCLRTREGMLFNHFEQRWGKQALEHLLQKVGKLPRGRILLTHKGIYVPVRNFMISDGIIRELLEFDA
ncbi:MAG: radical SAM family heme chaperone HemW [Bacteroidales bacterium]